MGSENFWRTLFDPRGRRSRAGFWAYVGISMLGYLACLFLASILGEIVPALFMVVFGIALLAMLTGSVINAIRRLHDLGHTGWWMALFIPLQLVLVLAAHGEGEGSGYVFSGLQGLLNLGLLIWLGCIPGQPDANRYGPSPLAEPEAAAA